MLSRIFPERIDNKHRGHKLALWFFVPITVMKIGISLLHALSADGGAAISTIPIDTYTPGGEQNVIALIARLGLEQFTLGLILAIVLFRYRSMIPLMYVLIVFNHIGLKGLSYLKPLALAGTSGASVPALVLMVLSVGGLVLSLIGKGYKE